jgi:hypothetical protein
MRPGGRTSLARGCVCAAAPETGHLRARRDSRRDSTPPGWRAHREESAIPTTGTNHRRLPDHARHDTGPDRQHPTVIAVPGQAVSGHVGCPRCGLVVAPASDTDRATDVLGPHPPGWRLCWCGHAWTPPCAPRSGAESTVPTQVGGGLGSADHADEEDGDG